jgi:hypothetical protein
MAEWPAQAVLTDTASGPLAPCITPTQTVWPSISCGTPLRWRADAGTKTSLPLSAIATKPKPLVALYHLTVPLDGSFQSGTTARVGWRVRRLRSAIWSLSARALVHCKHFRNLAPLLPLANPDAQ